MLTVTVFLAAALDRHKVTSSLYHDRAVHQLACSGGLQYRTFQIQQNPQPYILGVALSFKVELLRSSSQHVQQPHPPAAHTRFALGPLQGATFFLFGKAKFWPRETHN